VFRTGSILFLSLLFSACQPASEDAGARVRLTVAAAPDISQPLGDAPVPIRSLSPAAEQKKIILQRIIERDSLSRLVLQARSEPAFISNFAGESHRVHWDLLRRTGFDPLRQLRQLFEGPYGVRQVGDEIWFIWPDLAARAPEELIVEKLSYVDRARLQSLIGSSGMKQIAAGQGYPGVRTAISDSGRWLYFVHESEDEIQGEQP